MEELRKKETSEVNGFEFWEKTLNKARLVVAPMVDASELAWRMLSRKYGAELCYTPMLHSSVFVKDVRYRKDNLSSCGQDRPLIVQFCSHDPDTFVKACSLAAPYCDAIDLNLGCPQTIAKKGHYGAFLMEEWDLISTMIKRATKEVGIPITAKIRIFSDVEMTIKYAKMIEAAGASLLSVHARTRDQKGAMTGKADWSYIKAVREAVNLPIFANGNIQYLTDVDNCLEFTGAQGVMTAEGNLHNPAIFTGEAPLVWDIVLEYLDFVKLYPCPLSYSRGHVFKILHHCFNMPENHDLRYEMSKCPSVDDMIVTTELLKKRMTDYSSGNKIWEAPEEGPLSNLKYVPWFCQPYVRIPAEEHKRKIDEAQKRALEKQKEESLNGTKKVCIEGERILSKKKLKRLKKNPRKKFDHPVQEYEKCSCKNPRGSKCEFLLCKSCCKLKCHLEDSECKGHRINMNRQKNQLQPKSQQLDNEKTENRNTQINEKSINDNLTSLPIPDSVQEPKHSSEDLSRKVDEDKSSSATITIQNGQSSLDSETMECGP